MRAKYRALSVPYLFGAGWINRKGARHRKNPFKKSSGSNEVGSMCGIFFPHLFHLRFHSLGHTNTHILRLSLLG